MNANFQDNPDYTGSNRLTVAFSK